jgi:hypothetical protein
VVARDEFVRGDDAEEVAVVPAHGGEFILVGHGIGGVGHAHGGLAVDCVGKGFLGVRGNHFEPPDFLAERGDGDEVVFAEESDGADGFGGGEVGLTAGRDVGAFDGFEGIPCGAAHGFGGVAQLFFAPCEFAFCDGDEFAGGVGDQFAGDACGEGVRSDGVADERVVRLAFLGGEFFAEVSGVLFEGFVGFGVGLAGPP